MIFDKNNHGKAIDAIIWDLDGTLLNSLEISTGVWQKVLPRHGYPTPTAMDVARNYHGTLQDTIVGLAPHASSEQAKIILDDFLEVDNAYIRDANHHLFPDAVRLAERAHGEGIKQILVTNRAHGTNRQNASPVPKF